MIKSDIKLITAEPESVEINKAELARRLGVKFGHKNGIDEIGEIIEKCQKNLMKFINYKCAYIRTPVDLSSENICKFDFAQIQTKNLYTNLSGCNEAFIMALTIGLAVDREMAKLKIISQAEHFVTDALASTAAESFCDYVCEVIKSNENVICKNRFSPGYGDVSLTFQEPLLERLNAANLIGITLSDSYLMTPMKSITAIMGIKK